MIFGIAVDVAWIWIEPSKSQGALTESAEKARVHPLEHRSKLSLTSCRWATPTHFAAEDTSARIKLSLVIDLAREVKPEAIAIRSPLAASQSG